MVNINTPITKESFKEIIKRYPNMFDLRTGKLIPSSKYGMADTEHLYHFITENTRPLYDIDNKYVGFQAGVCTIYTSNKYENKPRNIPDHYWMDHDTFMGYFVSNTKPSRMPDRYWACVLHAHCIIIRDAAAKNRRIQKGRDPNYLNTKQKCIDFLALRTPMKEDNIKSRWL